MEGRLPEMRADQRVRPLAGVREIAGHGVKGHGLRKVRERARLGVAPLDLGLVEVGTGHGQPRRGAGLQPRDRKPQRAQRRGKPARRDLPVPPARKRLQADVNEAVEEGPGAHDHGPGPNLLAGPGDRSKDAARLHEKGLGDALAQLDARGALHHATHLDLVGALVGLGSRGPHRRPAASVQHLELDAGPVDDPAHRAAERIDLAHQLALGQAADRGIAGHLGDGVEIAGQQHGIAAHPGGRERGFAARVARADDENVTVVAHEIRIVRCGGGGGKAGIGSAATGGGGKKGIGLVAAAGGW